MNRKITIGIVSYNTPPQTLQKLVSSLKNSNLSATIVLLCNSENTSYQIEICELSKEYGVEFLGNQPNRGFGAGHNSIARAFPAEWYICCNPDVVVKQDTISELLGFAEKNNDAILLMPRVLSKDGSIQPLARKTLTPISWFHRQLWRLMPRLFRPFELRFDYKKSQPVDFVTGCFFAVKQEHFWKLGGFDESFFLYSEDADLSYRAKSLGVNYFVATSEICHLWTTNSCRNRKIILLELKSLYHYFNKHKLWLSFL